MTFYQYVRRDHTKTKLVKDWEKIKVVYGEIIESSLDPMYFLENGFKQIDEGGNSITVVAKRWKAKGGRKSKK